MQHLVKGGSVHPLDGVHITRILWIQANVCAGTFGAVPLSAPGADGGGVG